MQFLQAAGQDLSGSHQWCKHLPWWGTPVIYSIKKTKNIYNKRLWCCSIKIAQQLTNKCGYGCCKFWRLTQKRMNSRELFLLLARSRKTNYSNLSKIGKVLKNPFPTETCQKKGFTDSQELSHEVTIGWPNQDFFMAGTKPNCNQQIPYQIHPPQPSSCLLVMPLLWASVTWRRPRLVLDTELLATCVTTWIRPCVFTQEQLAFKIMYS